MGVLTILKKELRSYFVSPIAYVMAGIFLAVSGYFFFNAVGFFTLATLQYSRFPDALAQLQVEKQVFQPVFQDMGVVLLLILPLLTMRLLSEEKKSGTAELLMTSPVSLLSIIVGKFLAAAILFALILGLTLYMPFFVAVVGRLSWGGIASSYLGLLLMGWSFIAVGLFASSLSENQVIAAVVAFGTLFFFWVIQWGAESAGAGLGEVLSYLSITEHLKNALQGLIDTRDVLYYLSLTFLGIFLTHRVLESQRWR